jgi:uncharacterized membrane protein YraQ (UPF0718 family)
MSSLTLFLGAFLEIAAEASSWLLLGFAFAGLVHEFISVDKMVKHFGEKGFLPLLKSSAIGVFLPMCSCGVIPAGIGMYKTGASLGSTLAFMTSTPAINPAAIALCWSLLGPKITLAYFLTAFLSAFLIGLIGNRFGGKEVFSPDLEREKEMQLLEFKETSLTKRILSALRWGFFDLGSEVAFYVLIGFFLAALIAAFVPSVTVESYLGKHALTSLFLVALIGVPLYVCAVGSIPLVAALVAKGALPGVAIVFLMAGPATNMAELLAIFKSISRRAAILYASLVFFLSILGGFLTNLFLSSEKISISAEILNKTTQASKVSSYISNYYCSNYNLVAMAFLFILMAYGLYRRVAFLGKGVREEKIADKTFQRL